MPFPASSSAPPGNLRGGLTVGTTHGYTVAVHTLWQELCGVIISVPTDRPWRLGTHRMLSIYRLAAGDQTQGSMSPLLLAGHLVPLP